MGEIVLDIFGDGEGDGGESNGAAEKPAYALLRKGKSRLASPSVKRATERLKANGDELYHLKYPVRVIGKGLVLGNPLSGGLERGPLGLWYHHPLPGQILQGLLWWCCHVFTVYLSRHHKTSLNPQ